jgi:folate-binding protein YgfZ
MTTNELRNLHAGEGQINVIADQKGRIVDRCIFYKLQDAIWITTSPGNSEKVANWIQKYTFIEDVTIQNGSYDFGMLSLFGPKSPDLMSMVLGDDFTELADYHHREATFDNQAIKVSASAELAVVGFNLIVKSDVLLPLWDALMEKGNQVDLMPMGEETYEVLRIENGWPLYGKDFDENINPHEAQMLPYMDFHKGCYIGQEVIARLDTYEKVQKHLMGFVLDGETLPAPKDPVIIDGEEAGFLTSMARSEGLKRNVALGYVRTKYIREDAEAIIKSEVSEMVGKLVKLPIINVVCP